MAKTTKKKPAAGPKYPKKPTGRGLRSSAQRTAAAGTRQAAPKKKGPRSQVLPGMERVRDAKLDRFCEDAGDGLVAIGAGTSAVDDAKRAALQRMRDRGMSSYVHAGVRFTLKPGVDAISVKREKDKSATAAAFSGPSQNAETPEAERGGIGDAQTEAYGPEPGTEGADGFDIH